ncbi:hypothetical protein LOK49_LG11G01553 [Camellia lanceoleosa]|uniref:Uncharacterized protein n=1 Tax=Camellia lanceoleosa TaxID=1840588 RepID=A0ACC0FX45_9ERIC|nr:hypothetical protein LOK49_LG11G01553 [Camellia lanceoleosa]
MVVGETQPACNLHFGGDPSTFAACSRFPGQAGQCIHMRRSFFLLMSWIQQFSPSTPIRIADFSLEVHPGQNLANFQFVSGDTFGHHVRRILVCVNLH